MGKTDSKALDVKQIAKKIGLPRLIIGSFFIFILISAFFLGIPMDMLTSDVIRRVGMNGILVLAMVPSIQSGTGPNFALPIGIVCGLLGLMLSIELGFMGFACILMAMLIATLVAIVLGYFYGKMLNAVKGAEMTIATYTGFSIVALSSLAWITIPFKNPNIGWFLGDGLRETVQLKVFGAAQVFDNFLQFYIGGVKIPTGLLLVFGFFCIAIWLFFKTKTGIAISAGGINPKFAMVSGLNIDKNRIIANIVSTVLGAIGIIVYAQCYGYAQLYTAPLMMAFPAVAAVLIGGATAKRASVTHVIIGVILFQGLLTTALPVANQVFAGTDLSDIMRMIIQNGIILYALTQVKGGAK